MKVGCKNGLVEARGRGITGIRNTRDLEAAPQSPGQTAENVQLPALSGSLSLRRVASNIDGFPIFKSSILLTLSSKFSFATSIPIH